MVVSASLLVLAGSCDARSSAKGENPHGVVGSVKIGARVPALVLRDHMGRKVRLVDASYRATLLYFYPRDNTPGCTIEAQRIRDQWDDFKKANVRVLGVSTDGQASHAQFASEQHLPFGLLSDERGQLSKPFDVPVRLGFAKRTSFLWDRQGTLRMVFRDVDPATHAAQVLKAAATF